MIQIMWDYISPKGDHWCEWQKDGRTRMKRVTQEEYDALTANNQGGNAVQQSDEDLDFLN